MPCRVDLVRGEDSPVAATLSRRRIRGVYVLVGGVEDDTQLHSLQVLEATGHEED